MDQKHAVPPSYDEASSGQTSATNQGYAPYPGDHSGYPSSYPPQQQYGMGYAAQGGYPPTQQGYNYQSSNTVVVTQPVTAVPVIHSVQDNMGLAIFTTICCCWPLGIVAIMRASESRAALAQGDLARAQTYSQESRRYSMFAIAGGCVSIVLIIVLSVVLTVVNTNRAYSYYG